MRTSNPIFIFAASMVVGSALHIAGGFDQSPGWFWRLAFSAILGGVTVEIGKIILCAFHKKGGEGGPR
jgi:hypothetical protein